MTVLPNLGLRRMRPHDPSARRPASSLELFFDLVFVVAVSIAAANLHHELTEGHVLDGILSYLLVFVTVWWAWMNFTWFASAFSIDDWLYRVLTIVQMGGVLVLAAGIGPAFHQDYALTLAGYVIMRVAMVAQWLRASRSAGAARRTTRLYAFGVLGVQLLWVSILWLPLGPKMIAFLVLIGVELTIPLLGERLGGGTPWNAEHITERYGLFTLIVLGESLLASANAIVGALAEAESAAPLVGVAALTLVITAALWWIYFWPPHDRAVGGFWRTFGYGYLHYIVFAAAGALSAGIEVEIDVLEHDSALDQAGAGWAVAVPVGVFVLAVWWIALRPFGGRVVNLAFPIGAAIILLDPLLPLPFPITAVVLVALVALLATRTPLLPVAPAALPHNVADSRPAATRDAS